MDINCTFNCAYQKEGKCTLETVSEPKTRIIGDNIDCLYFNEKNIKRD